MRWLAHHLVSLETLLVMFIYGAHLKLVVPSPPVPETAFYGVLSFAVAFWIALRQGIYLRGVPIVATALLFSGWMAISYGWSPPAVVGKERLIYVLGIDLVAVLIAACVVAGSRERVLRFLLLVVLVSIVLSVYGTYIDFTHGDFRFYNGPNGDWPKRTYLAWGNIVATGSAVALAALIYTRFGSARQLLAAAAAAICVLFMLVGGPRGALVGTLLALAANFSLNMPRIRDGRIELPPAQIAAFLAIAAVAVYVLYAISTGQMPATLSRFSGLLDQAGDSLLREGANRFDYYAGAYRAWLQSPLFGQGLGGFTIFFCGYDQEGCFPHNVLLQSLADFGLIGFVLYVAFLWTGIRHLKMTRLRQDPLRMTLLMAFITVAVHALVNVDLTLFHRLFFFVGLLALRPPPPERLPDMEEDG